MDYQSIYNKLMERAKIRNWRSDRWRVGETDSPTYTEVHHIIPRCLGGSDEKSNLVVLTMREHFLAHMLLSKIYNDNDSITLAFSIMINRTEGKSMNNYAIHKEKHFIAMSNFHKEYWTDEKRENARIKGLELAQDEDYLNKVSEGVRRAYETTNLREKISKTSLERYEDPEYYEYWYNSVLKWNEEFWTPEKREEWGLMVKKQNEENPELAKVRRDAIKYHQYNKTEEWTKRAVKWMNDWHVQNPEARRELYFKEGNKFNNSRAVRHKETGKVYTSMNQAAKDIGMNYSTVKKYLYNGKDFVLEFFNKED